MIKASDMKPGRVKVGIRCRPAFQDEIDFAKGEFLSIVDIKPDDAKQSSLGQISLTLITGKQRDFTYDYAFDVTSTQDQVYDRVARPVVTDVLKGFNGTIFAYGQTGTGKTYTMGILEFVNNEHAGIIPRAISQIFEYVESQNSTEVSVSLSFLQLYRETIQDLLSPGATSGDDNLLIREDPQRGFFVEGLQEFAVRNYREAEALVNLGLENRAIAPTLMNTTSSRSHTVLTINMVQRVSGDGKVMSKTVRSKLLMVDLAGSERVRRTVSKGTRLSEAKSINTSLSALGNVIAALAEQNTTHVPYRDSKLTRLLQDSLGGTASTALIATVGPAAVNYGETLSTLLFASRCMAVKITPVQHEEIDYAEMCAKLQTQLSNMEGIMIEKLAEQQDRHDQVVRELHESLTAEKNSMLQQKFVASMETTSAARASFDAELNSILDRLERVRSSSTGNSLQSWLGKEVGWSPTSEEGKKPDAKLVTLLGYSFEVVSYMCKVLKDLMQNNVDREESNHNDTEEKFIITKQNEVNRETEMRAMESEDPREQHQSSDDTSEGADKKIGSHLAPMTKLQAMIQVEGKYRSNNEPASQYDNLAVSSVAESVVPRPSIHNYKNAEEIAIALASMHSSIRQNSTALNALLVRKDEHFKTVKSDLVEQMVEKRKREEEVINWSYILKYLLASSSKLRKQLQREKKIQAAWAQAVPNYSNGANNGTHKNNNNAPLRSALNDLKVHDADSMSMSTVGQLFSKALSEHQNNSMIDNNSYSEVPDDEDDEDPEDVGVVPPPLSVNNVQFAPPPPTIEVPRVSSQPGYRPDYDLMSEMTMSPPGINPTNRQTAASKKPILERKQLPVNKAPIALAPPVFPAVSIHPSAARAPVAAVDFDTYAYSVDESDLSVTTTTRSIVSNPNGVPTSYQRPSALTTPNFRNAPQYSPYGNGIGASNVIKQPIPRSGAKNGIRSSSPTARSSAPSDFAKEVVSGLGVDSHQAAVAMSIVDKVSQITPEQLNLLDPETRAQILQIRKELNISSGGSGTPAAASRRAVSPSPTLSSNKDRSPYRSNSNPRSAQKSVETVRSLSAPRSRTLNSNSDSPPLKTASMGLSSWKPSVSLDELEAMHQERQRVQLLQQQQLQHQQQLEIQRRQQALLSAENPRRSYAAPAVPLMRSKNYSYEEQVSPADASRGSQNNNRGAEDVVSQGSEGRRRRHRSSSNNQQREVDRESDHMSVGERSDASNNSRRRRHYPPGDYLGHMEPSNTDKQYPGSGAEEDAATPRLRNRPISGREHLYASREAGARKEQMQVKQSQPDSDSRYSSGRRLPSMQQSSMYAPHREDVSDDEFSQLDI